jgi:flotillin
MARTLPPMMQVMKDIGGIELPEALVKFTEDEKKEPIAATNGGRVPPATSPRGAKDGSSGAT